MLRMPSPRRSRSNPSLISSSGIRELMPLDESGVESGGEDTSEERRALHRQLQTGRFRKPTTRLRR